MGFQPKTLIFPWETDVLQLKHGGVQGSQWCSSTAEWESWRRIHTRAPLVSTKIEYLKHKIPIFQYKSQHFNTNPNISIYKRRSTPQPLWLNEIHWMFHSILCSMKFITLDWTLACFGLDLAPNLAPNLALFRRRSGRWDRELQHIVQCIGGNRRPRHQLHGRWADGVCPRRARDAAARGRSPEQPLDHPDLLAGGALRSGGRSASRVRMAMEIPAAFGIFCWKCRDNGELPVEDDNFVWKTGQLLLQFEVPWGWEWGRDFHGGGGTLYCRWYCRWWMMDFTLKSFLV